MFQISHRGPYAQVILHNPQREQTALGQDCTPLYTQSRIDASITQGRRFVDFVAANLTNQNPNDVADSMALWCDYDFDVYVE